MTSKPCETRLYLKAMRLSENDPRAALVKLRKALQFCHQAYQGAIYKTLQEIGKRR